MKVLSSVTLSPGFFGKEDLRPSPGSFNRARMMRALRAGASQEGNPIEMGWKHPETTFSPSPRNRGKGPPQAAGKREKSMKQWMMGMGLLAAVGAWAQSDEKVSPAPEAEVQTAPAESALKEGEAQAAPSEEIRNLKGALDGLNESFLETRSSVDKLSRIKVSGYIQPQWQWADSAVAHNSPVGGGWTPGGNNQRFAVRRGRVKTAYETLSSRYVLQIDVTPAAVTLKDAYVTLMEPWAKTFSATMGVFDRPFGFEIAYSSSSRESPERSRVFQALFPGERDLGGKIDIAPPDGLGFAQYLNFKGGVFTGMGGNAAEIDKEQDYIGRLGFQAPLYDLNLAIDGGFSFYRGKSVNANDTLLAFSRDSVGRFSSATGRRNSIQGRDINGADAQIYYDLPVLGGFSLRGEYLWGRLPSTRGATGPYLAATAPMAIRRVSGFYAIWVQNLGPKVQSVVKYDRYDPNTDVEGDDVGRPGSNLNANDLAFKTLGLGLLYYWDENIRLMAYYDKIANEEAFPGTTAAALVPWKRDITDNVFTFRAQMKF
jgi:hypothetical protein